MPENQQNNLPVILLSSSMGNSASISAELLARGFTVMAACGTDDSNGNALRAGLETFKQETPELPGLVWLDSAAGYSVEDIVAVADALTVNSGKIAIAARPWGKGLGVAARLEARAAHLAFAAAHGRPVQDPWCGLVGLPASHVQDFLGEKGQGEGYLFRLLLTMQRHGIQVVNVPVGAPYRRRGATAGERALGIARIALLPLLFVSSSFLLTCADLCVNFSFYYLLLPGIKPVSIAAGRFTGALVGYLLNRAVVFKRAGRTRQEEAAATAKYAVLFVGMYLSALLLISIMVDEFHWAYALATVIASVLLYAPNYFIQRDVVFRRRQRRPALREGAFHERY